MPSKTKKFLENHQLKNVWEYDRDNIRKKIKKISRPWWKPSIKEIILELGCGGGDYVLALAQIHKNKIIIGVDLQGERLWHGATTALNKKIKNAFFIRADIRQLAKYFPPHSISEIWLTFPDPYPKNRQERKRITSADFLTIYKKIIKKDGTLHLKTDDEAFFEYSKKVIIQNNGRIIEKIKNIYNQKSSNPLTTKIQTFYEKQHIKNDRTINYIKFKLQ